MEKTQRFIEELKNNDCEVFLVDSSKLREDLIKFLKSEGADRILVRPSELINSLGLDGHFDLVQGIEDGVRFGISEPEFGIVYSGGLVELARNIEEKVPSLLPDVHVAILKEENIIEDFDELISGLNPPLPDITFIVGPSKTADIEKILVKGAHGPARLVVFIVKRGSI